MKSRRVFQLSTVVSVSIPDSAGLIDSISCGFLSGYVVQLMLIRISMAFLLGMKKKQFRLHSDPGVYQRVISVAICTVVAAGDDRNKLMPMTRPRMSQGHFVTWFVIEECVSDCHSMMAAGLKKCLSICDHFPMLWCPVHVDDASSLASTLE